MEKQTDGTVKLSVVMNRQAMTADEQTQFLKDLSAILGVEPEDIVNPTFTTAAAAPGATRQP